MARIRSLKPEFWDDRKLARSVSRDARMLYMGLWNQADEHARCNGDPHWIRGRVFPYEDDIDADAVDRLLDELGAAKRVHRYTVHGDPYLFLPNLAKHQRLDAEKVPSRLPGIDESDSRPDESEPDTDESESGGGSSALLYVAGSRGQVSGCMDQGSTSSDGHEADPDTAQTIIREYVKSCRKRPPESVVGQIGRHVAQMLEEGIDASDIRRAIREWAPKGLHPSALPSVVNEVMNAPKAGARGKATPDLPAYESATDVLARLDAIHAKGGSP